MAYGWPGNTGELEMVLEHASELAKGRDNCIGKESLPNLSADPAASELRREQESLRGRALKEFLHQRLASMSRRVPPPESREP